MVERMCTSDVALLLNVHNVNGKYVGITTVPTMHQAPGLSGVYSTVYTVVILVFVSDSLYRRTFDL